MMTTTTATCGNCGKTYQAPANLIGKTVRCKACGGTFRVPAPADPEANGGIDLDALERSFADVDVSPGASATVLTRTATGVRPAIDAHDRASIERDPATEGHDLFSDGDTTAGYRSNLRFRYPFAKQIDQFLPWTLVALTLFVIVSSSLNTEATGHPAPSTVVGLSRATVLITAYALLIWPAVHVALRSASRKARVRLPRHPAWRSFAGFMPVLLLGGGLFIASGGDVALLIVGTLLGVALSITATAVLFRLLPQELVPVGSYTGAAAAIAATLAIGIVLAINLVGISISRSEPTPTVNVSPIAIGMRWDDRPATPTPTAKPTRPTAVANTTPNSTPSTTVPATPDQATPAGLRDVPLPVIASGEQQLLQHLQATPIANGFSTAIVPTTQSPAIGIVRADGGGKIEVWERDGWSRPVDQIGRDFDATRSPLHLSPSGQHVFRVVSTPSNRIEEIPLGNARTLPPTRIPDDATSAQRVIVGLVGETELLAATFNNDNTVGLERFDLSAAIRAMRVPVLRYNAGPIAVDQSRAHVIRVTPDGKSLFVACRVPGGQGQADAMLLRYDVARASRATAACEVWISRSTPLAPAGFAVDAGGTRVALLLNAEGEMNLSICDLSPASGSDAPPRQPSVDRKIGLARTLRPETWDDSYDPVTWLDDHTLLIYGRTLVDVDTGRPIGVINLPRLIGQLPRVDSEGAILLIQDAGDARTLLRAKLDPAALKAARE